MKKYLFHTNKIFYQIVCMLFFLFLVFVCISSNNIELKYKKHKFIQKNIISIWYNVIQKVSNKYHIDNRLISAIIYVESSGNPKAISDSNAIGLMQIKSNSAGKEVYKIIGKKGIPSVSELLNPQKNIDIGAKYIQILQKKNLHGISKLKNLRFATIVSYCNGYNAFLKIFSTNKKKAIIKINAMNSHQLIKYINKHHPSKQAIRYLSKVLKIYNIL